MYIKGPRDYFIVRISSNFNIRDFDKKIKKEEEEGKI